MAPCCRFRKLIYRYNQAHLIFLFYFFLSVLSRAFFVYMCNIDWNQDFLLLFLARFVRLFSYGMLSVALILYLTEIGFDQWQIGILFTVILIGDIIITLMLTTTADSLGRRNILVIGSLLKIFAGITFAFGKHYVLLVLAGIVGIISPTGGEIGPFLAIEQACLTERIKDKVKIARIFGWYNFCGYVSTALGALTSGYVISMMRTKYHLPSVDAYRTVIVGYAFFGGIKTLLYLCLSPRIEATSPDPESSVTVPVPSPSHSEDDNKNLVARTLNWCNRKFGLRRASSRRTVAKLCALFIIDSIAGGFVMQSMIVFWFHERFQMETEMLGFMMMLANLVSGISAVLATPLVARFGAINTMVITHIPSNIFLLLIPFMPGKMSAVVMLLLRFSISQMDVPARQTFVTTSVESDERSAAGGVTNLIRSVGLSISPVIVGYLLKDSKKPILFSSPFVIAGGLKLLYDVLLYLSFRSWNQNKISEKENLRDYHDIEMKKNEMK